MSDFKGRHFRGEIVLWAVRWYCRYAVSYRDLEAMMTEARRRGRPLHDLSLGAAVRSGNGERLRWQWRRPQSVSWRIDETYIKVRGKWAIPVPGARQAREHDRLLPLGDAQHQGGEAIPRQGAERTEGVGAARGAQHRQGADLCRCHRRSSRPRANAPLRRGTGR